MMQVDRHLDILDRLVRRSPAAVAGVRQIRVEQRLVDPSQIDGANAWGEERREMLDVAQQPDRPSHATWRPVSRHMDAEPSEHVLLGEPPGHGINDAGEIEPVVAVAGVHPEDGDSQIPVIITEVPPVSVRTKTTSTAIGAC